jgi:hypothetical protein
MKKKLKPGWVKIEAAIHVASRRIGRLLPLRVEPGRKFQLGTKTLVRGIPFRVMGFGYELGKPTIHFQKIRTTKLRAA